MDSLKIRVNNEAESKEAQELFFELGYVWFYNMGKRIENVTGVIKASSDGTMCSGDVFKTDHKELTIPELRDIVVLKRNDVGDATHTGRSGSQYYIGVKSYFWDGMKWEQRDFLNLGHLKPIEKEMKMKEYLDKDYVLRSVKQTAGDNRVPDGWIEVPEGANFAYMATRGAIVFMNTRNEISSVRDSEIVWQRSETENTEQLKGIDKTLVERQATYGCFVGVANTTGQLMGVIKNSANGHTLPYAHEEALHMICSKIARIVNGDYNHKDSWHDIGGYAKLVEDLL